MVRGLGTRASSAAGDRSGEQVPPIILHGDAAFAGQGVNMEMFNMSQARGYGRRHLHIVINTRLGTTTSNTLDSRSTTYCTDVAKVVQAPIFHVNGDDPEAVPVTRLALEYRNRFRKDVVIDLIVLPPRATTRPTNRRSRNR